jgi:hypothetical protein
MPGAAIRERYRKIVTHLSYEFPDDVGSARSAHLRGISEQRIYAIQGNHVIMEQLVWRVHGFHLHEFGTTQMSHPRFKGGILAIQNFEEAKIRVEKVCFSIVCPNNEHSFAVDTRDGRQRDTNGMHTSKEKLATIHRILMHRMMKRVIDPWL